MYIFSFARWGDHGRIRASASGPPEGLDSFVEALESAGEAAGGWRGVGGHVELATV